MCILDICIFYKYVHFELYTYTQFGRKGYSTSWSHVKGMRYYKIQDTCVVCTACKFNKFFKFFSRGKLGVRICTVDMLKYLLVAAWQKKMSSVMKV